MNPRAFIKLLCTSPLVLPGTISAITSSAPAVDQQISGKTMQAHCSSAGVPRLLAWLALLHTSAYLSEAEQRQRANDCCLFIALVRPFDPQSGDGLRR